MQMRTVAIIALVALLAIGVASVPAVYAEEQCKTALVGAADLVDPTGYPTDRGSPTPLTLNRSVIILETRNTESTQELPPFFPPEWTPKSTSVSVERVHYVEDGVGADYWILRFSKPLALCDVLAGWESWTNSVNMTRSVESKFLDAYLVFERNGRLEFLRPEISVVLASGVSPEEFIKEVFPRFSSSAPGAGSTDPRDTTQRALLSATYFTRMDPDRKEWRVNVKASQDVFPLRAAIRLADYAGSGKHWISQVYPKFVPLISEIKVESVFEQLRLGGGVYRTAEEEPISVPILYTPGIRLNVVIDLMRDKNGAPLYRLLTSPQEFQTRLMAAFTEKKENQGPGNGGAAETKGLQIGEFIPIGDGCVGATGRAPDRRYARETITCTFYIMKAGNFVIGQIPFRVERKSSGAELEIKTDRNLLLVIQRMRHPSQEQGFNGAIPWPSYQAKPRGAKSAPAVAPPPAVAFPQGERFVQKQMVHPVLRFWGEFRKDPIGMLKGKVAGVLLRGFAFFAFLFLLTTRIPLGRRFRLPSGWMILVSVLCGAWRYTRIVALSFGAPFIGRRDALARLIALAANDPLLRNLNTEALAMRWHIRMPPEREEFLVWARGEDRSRLECAIAFIRVEENRAAWTEGYVYETRTVLLGKISSLRRYAFLGPFFALSREIRKRGGRS